MFEIDMMFAFALFGIGLYGVSAGNDFLRIFFSLEMLLNAVILMLASSAHYLGLVQNLLAHELPFSVQEGLASELDIRIPANSDRSLL